MERIIPVQITDKVATSDYKLSVVCNNSDYEVQFTFDDEWDGIEIKTARFAANGKHTDIIFTGETVSMPPIPNAAYVLIGVFAGDMASTPVRLKCEKSIMSEGGEVQPPSDDIYNQLMETLNEIQEQGVTDERIAESVAAYLAENPIIPGASEAEAQQILQNANDIEELREDFETYEMPIATGETIGGIMVGENLLVSESGVLSVDTAKSAEKDNTKPITAAAVYTEIGNIDSLLGTI